MEGTVPMRDLRSLACSCYTARMLVSATLRSQELSVGAADTSWHNAAFVARLPGLVRLRVRGDPLLPIIDLAAVRSKPRMRLKSADGTATISEAGALFLGALIGGGEHTLRLTDNVSYLNLASLRAPGQNELNKVSLLSPLLGSKQSRAPDALVALGALARNEGGWQLQTDATTLKELVVHAQLTVCAR